jgi:adenylosuccinate lyase
VRAADLLLADDQLLAGSKRALEHSSLPIVRSHGIHAEPTTSASCRRQAYAEFATREGAPARRAEVATCAISGAVGTFANVDPRVEPCRRQDGPFPGPISTQVIPRDRHAIYFATLAVIASSLERLAIEVRHSAHRGAGGGGILSRGSGPPPCRTRQPVFSENITGSPAWCELRRRPRNVALWHERDIPTLPSSA